MAAPTLSPDFTPPHCTDLVFREGLQPRPTRHVGDTYHPSTALLDESSLAASRYSYSASRNMLKSEWPGDECDPPVEPPRATPSADATDLATALRDEPGPAGGRRPATGSRRTRAEPPAAQQRRGTHRAPRAPLGQLQHLHPVGERRAQPGQLHLRHRPVRPRTRRLADTARPGDRCGAALRNPQPLGLYGPADRNPARSCRPGRSSGSTGR
jgi:hypothetical protein